MSISLTPQQAQRRTIRLLNYEDGLWDILLGLIFLELSVYPITRRLLGPSWNLALYLAVLAVLVVGLSLIRRAVATPRIGTARMRRTPAKSILLVLLAASVIATLALVVLTLRDPAWLAVPQLPGLPAWVGDLSVDIGLTLLLVVVFSVMGYLFRVVRLFLYGWLIGLGNLASTVLALYRGAEFNLPLAIAAMVILMIGVTLLVRFLRRYPAADAAEAE